ncbi:hypothetical protein AK812_SmicGene10794 [Symbiodinium microadriaticum]|uniref:Uncharacterized protein n=1 Tax=Symbiodinium microadriaticum TaxID=2951 RepID=A0A1Q9EF00_SYMMI|nr:hypothetical protein AK812_SmicGene10794 [Symbiodinium microadriaticum]
MAEGEEGAAKAAAKKKRKAAAVDDVHWGNVMKDVKYVPLADKSLTERKKWELAEDLNLSYFYGRDDLADCAIRSVAQGCPPSSPSNRIRHFQLVRAFFFTLGVVALLGLWKLQRHLLEYTQL